MNVAYRVELEAEERQDLLNLSKGGTVGARKMKRAQILLMADDGRGDGEIAKAIPVGTATVYRTKRRFVEEGLDAALSEKERPGGERKLSGNQEAVLVALACSGPPEGRTRWTLQLLARALIVLTDVDAVSVQTVRRRLADNNLKPWQKKMWCLPKVDAAFVAQMEDILDLYAEPADPQRPVICFDESPTQLIGEARTPLPMRPGKPALYDYEYKRNGTANLFVHFDRHRSWRHVDVTERRSNVDFAHRMRDLVDVHYPDANVLRLVLDNLSTHTAAALYQTFPPHEARRILRKLEFHYTPKHASWLNMVEIEIGVMKTQCLDRRIPNKQMLKQEIASWQRQRNEEECTIDWCFTVDKARSKMARCYPKLPSDPVEAEPAAPVQRSANASTRKVKPTKKKKSWIQPFKTPGKRY